MSDIFQHREMARRAAKRIHTAAVPFAGAYLFCVYLLLCMVVDLINYKEAERLYNIALWKQIGLSFGVALYIILVMSCIQEFFKSIAKIKTND